MEKEELIIKDQQGNPIEIPLEGSIGLLAIGYTGLVAWRKKRKEEGVRREQEGENGK